MLSLLGLLMHTLLVRNQENCMNNVANAGEIIILQEKKTPLVRCQYLHIHLFLKLENATDNLRA